MLALFTFSHGNADADRGFSINKYLLGIHGSSASEKTVEAARLVKDHLILNGVSNVEVTRAMMRKCKELRERWMQDLKLQREQKDKEEAEIKAASLKRLEQEEEQEKKKKVKKDIETIQTSISLSEELLKSGQQELKEVKKMSNVDRLRLMAANAKISSGLKR